MIFALREGLRIILEEGLDEGFRRHETLADYLRSGLLVLGFNFSAQEGYRLPMLNSVVLPDGVGDEETRRRLLDYYGIEVGGGLGNTKGKIWRIGLMGETCKRKNIDALLSALRDLVR